MPWYPYSSSSLQSLKGGEEGVATSSGMAAILTFCMTVLRAGDHIVCSFNLFGSMVVVFNSICSKIEISVTLSALRELDQWRQAALPKTKLFICKTPSNLFCEAGNIREIANFAHNSGALPAEDNSFCTPVLQCLLSLRAHWATKYFDCQGRVLLSAVVGSEDLIA